MRLWCGLKTVDYRCASAPQPLFVRSFNTTVHRLLCFIGMETVSSEEGDTSGLEPDDLEAGLSSSDDGFGKASWLTRQTQIDACMRTAGLLGEKLLVFDDLDVLVDQPIDETGLQVSARQKDYHFQQLLLLHEVTQMAAPLAKRLRGDHWPEGRRTLQDQFSQGTSVGSGVQVLGIPSKGRRPRLTGRNCLGLPFTTAGEREEFERKDREYWIDRLIAILIEGNLPVVQMVQCA